MNTPSTVPKRKANTIVAAYLILKKNDTVCMSLRKNTGYSDGLYGLIAGHVEDGESASAAMIREAEEEAGIKIAPTHLKAVHILHRHSSERLSIDIFFECCIWDGSICNREPGKCEKLDFFPIDSLPSNTIDYVRDVIRAVERKEFYSEAGWPQFCR